MSSEQKVNEGNVTKEKKDLGYESVVSEELKNELLEVTDSFKAVGDNFKSNVAIFRQGYDT